MTGRRLDEDGSSAALGMVRTPVVRQARFEALSPRLGSDAVILVDRRVLRLHPAVRAGLAGHRVFPLRASENTKSLATIEALARRVGDASRQSAVVAVGGGTVGDTATVFAHLLRRGLRLIQVPTTLLAAVDSAIGGKGAVNVGAVKNALGVFHFPQEVWVCHELFTTLSPSQRREGLVEAYKLALLHGAAWRRWCKRPPTTQRLIREAQALKGAICLRDPYDTRGLRAGLNLGHTFGHVIEGLTKFRVSHGEAVGLGLWCALDVGRALGVTPPSLIEEVTARFPGPPDGRRRLRGALRQGRWRQVEALLRADKKKRGEDIVMVLIEEPGRWHLRAVPLTLLHSLWKRWVR